MDVATSLFDRLQARLAADNFAHGLGIKLVEAEPGRVKISLAIKSEHLNFMGWAHGGLTFALADTAFGLASNSRETHAVGIDAHIAYLSGVREGDTLFAEASEVSRTKRKGVYRIEVTRDQDNTNVVTFTGTVLVTDKAWDD